MNDNQSLNPLDIATSLKFLQNDANHLVPIFLIFLRFFVFLCMVIDVDVDLIVAIVMDIDINVKIVILGWSWCGKILSGEVSNTLYEDHFV